MLRREFLLTSVVLAGPALGCSGADSTPGADGLPFDATLFPQSVASGDPRVDRVVLWTRIGGTGTAARRTALLEMATDPEFTERIQLGEGAQLELNAERRWDYCVRVRVEGLEPATEYYYRFLTTHDGVLHRSRTGRTRTAPQSSSEEAVRCLVMSCQDYGGRYYLALRRAAELEAHFFIHLGDYVYETSGNPDFQSVDAIRQMRFGDREGALELGLTSSDGGEPMPTFLAAGSLDNYRDLYRTVRSDTDLQRLHERFAMIVIWDDHEFSDDAWGQNSTYQAGRIAELNPERRSNADQAWFEYMPVDYSAGPDFEFDREVPFPQNLKIYRDFTFGKHMHLLLTDLRRFRADHVIPEDAHPARIAVSEERALELLGRVPDSAESYLDFESEPARTLAVALQAAATQGFTPDPEQLQPAELEGKLTLAGVQALVANHNAWTTGDPLAAPEPDDSARRRGISFGLVGKLSRYTSFGSRYFVNPEAFGIVALDRYQASDGESEQVMGEEQELWFIDTLQQSKCTWKVWGNPYTLSVREVDLSSLLLEDTRLARRFSLSADDWSGFPNRRLKLLTALSELEDVIVVTGDSHSFFASGLGIPSAPSVLEFVCGAISSTTYRAALERGIGGVPSVAQLAPIAGRLIQQQNAEIAFQNVEDNGFALLVASASELNVTFYQIPHAELSDPMTDADNAEIATHFKEDNLRVRQGSASIERKTEDGYEAWDPTTKRWI